MFKLVLILACFVLSTVQSDNSDLTLDFAIKLKRDYADDIVSDLFAESHGLNKVARVILHFFLKLQFCTINVSKNVKKYLHICILRGRCYGD